jgi:hypothetical protein
VPSSHPRLKATTAEERRDSCWRRVRWPSPSGVSGNHTRASDAGPCLSSLSPSVGLVFHGQIRDCAGMVNHLPAGIASLRWSQALTLEDGSATLKSRLRDARKELSSNKAGNIECST